MRPRTLVASLVFFAAAGSALAQPKLGCPDATHHQFDFWIGHWDVFTPDGKQAGTNRIEAIAQGCALLENWEGRGGFAGKSLNLYDRSDQRWHQSWVDATGSRLQLAGRFADGRMVLEGETPDDEHPGGKQLHRIAWTPNADGSVRQLWETSTDGGKTWSTAFDGKYVKHQ